MHSQPIANNGSHLLLNKIQIRKIHRTKRRTLSFSEQQAAAIAAADVLTAHDLFQRSQHIACYLANDHELSCQPIIEAIWKANKQCYLPVLNEKNTLYFAAYHRNDVMRPNRYHILEPENTPQIAANELDLVLMPLVAFDLHGHRLGMGGGYYDRTFEFLLTTSLHKPDLVGLAYEEQHVETLPVDPWDVSMMGVLTEKKLVLF